MSRLGDFAKKATDGAGAWLEDNVKKAIGAAVLTLLGAGWIWVWSHFNPLFHYSVMTSSVSSHFVALAQILNQIDKDSKVYCTGGWDERFARIGLRKCYNFSFKPIASYRLTSCTRDQRTIELTTTDQLLALQTFDTALRPLRCLTITSKGANSYEIGQGKDADFRSIQFPNSPAQEMLFCGCSNREVTEIARVLGAKLR
ncbi:MAG: hypothetical protein JSR61_17605 [Proteobacteria bacterium]|nr:hypothetical protein [Pseudomonadota bacterium]